MEIAICQLLLGRKAEALSTLGVQEGASDSADSAADSGIVDFVQVGFQPFTITMRLPLRPAPTSTLQAFSVVFVQLKLKEGYRILRSKA